MAVEAAIAACPHCGREHGETVLRCPDTDMVLPLPGRLLEGKFRLLQQLGRGGMATVWLARHTLVDRNVAIKIIRPEVVRNEQIIARFRGEAKAAGRIAHRNVCEILDFGLGPLGPFIVMEQLEGQNLGQVLARWGTLTAAQTAAIVHPALDGLIAAHRRGIIHRDLKPENVFLHRNNEGRTVVKLMDFGVAKFTDGSGEVETEQGALLGTPQYMAPEQFKGADLADERTDVWGMGAILYRVLSGRDAFRGPTVAATLMKVTHEDPDSLRKERPELSEALDDLVTRCLQKNPADRFPTAEALKQALMLAVLEMADLDAFDWDAAPAAEPPVAEPLLPGPPIRAVQDAIPPPGVDVPFSIPPPSATDPLLAALAGAPTLGSPAPKDPEGKPPTVRGYGPLGEASAPRPSPPSASTSGSRTAAESSRIETPKAQRPADLSSASLEATLPRMPPQDEDTSQDRDAARPLPSRPQANRTWSRWSQRALVSLGFGAIVLGALAWRARTPVETSERPPLMQSAPPSTPAHRPPRANPMAGLPAPPPSEVLDLDPLGALPDAALDEIEVPAGEVDLAETETGAADLEPLDVVEPQPIEPVDPIGEATTPPPPPTEDAFALVRTEEWVTPRELGPITDHNTARRYCESLDQAKFAGLSGWQLANPGVATKLANTQMLPNGRYWTSARWKGKVIVVAVPKARQSSRLAQTRIAHPLCAAKVEIPPPTP